MIDPVAEKIKEQGLGRAAHNDADLVKEAQLAADGARALRSSAQTALSLSDKVFSGPAAEIGNMIGGWVSTFFPESKIATKVGMTEAYVAQVANLVRSKIQALGTGNAISNADLMFTEKSLGSILTTAKGKRAILTGLMLDSMTIEAEAENKARWFHEHGGTLEGYKKLTDQTGGYPLFVAGKNGVVSFDSYRKTYMTKFPSATPQQIMKDWQSESKRAAAALVTGR